MKKENIKRKMFDAKVHTLNAAQWFTFSIRWKIIKFRKAIKDKDIAKLIKQNKALKEVSDNYLNNIIKLQTEMAQLKQDLKEAMEYQDRTAIVMNELILKEAISKEVAIEKTSALVEIETRMQRIEKQLNNLAP